MKQGVKFFLPEGDRRGHDSHPAPGEVIGGHLQRRLNADDQGIPLPQLGHRRGGGGVACHHQGLDAVFIHQLFRRRQGQTADLFGAAAAVRGVGGVAEVDIIFLGHQPPQMPQHADPAHTGVKNPDGIVLGIHGFTRS